MTRMLCVQHNEAHAVCCVVQQVLDVLPELGPYEIRLGHTQVLSAALTAMALPPGVSPASVMALLASAAAVSAAHSSSDSTGLAGGPEAAAGSTATAAAAAHMVNMPTSSEGAGAQGGAGPVGGASVGRMHTWPAIRVGLDGLGLDSTPVSRCRQCVLQLPGGAGVQVWGQGRVQVEGLGRVEVEGLGSMQVWGSGRVQL